MAFTVSRLPLKPGPQTLSLDIGAAVYPIRLIYADAPEAGWLMDIATPDGNPLVCGIPLLPKSNLLAQYEYLGLPFTLFIVNTAAPSAPPLFDDLGDSTELYVLQAA